MRISVVLGVLLIVFTTQLTQAVPAAAPPHGFKALVFSKTKVFRQDSIEAGVQAVRTLGLQHDFEVDATEDAGAFTEANLANYDVVVFLNTTGDVLNDEQQAAFEQYIRDGGGFAGIHAAADTEYDWPFYGELVGAYFESHPPFEISRSWYTGGRHTIESFSEPLFREHLLYGIEFAAGVIPGDCGANAWYNYDRITLSTGQLASGVYFCRLQTPEGQRMQQFVVAR